MIVGILKSFVGLTMFDFISNGGAEGINLLLKSNSLKRGGAPSQGNPLNAYSISEPFEHPQILESTLPRFCNASEAMVIGVWGQRPDIRTPGNIEMLHCCYASNMRW